MSLAGDLARNILQIGVSSQSEEDLKIGVQRLLDDALKGLGLSYEAKYEKAIYKSRRADALYPTIVLEYKKPKALRSKKIQDDAIDALGDYLKGMSKTESVPRKFVGVALDGETILFVRTKPASAKLVAEKKKQYQATLEGNLLSEETKDWEVIGPEPITQVSIERLFLFFRALVYKILSPENLATDFGSETNMGKKFIGILHRKLISSKNPKIQMLLEEWSRIFGVVYGQDIKRLKTDTDFFAKTYDLPNVVSLQEVLFSVHTYFALLMKMLAAETLALQSGSLFPAILQKWAVVDDEKLKDELSDLENGGLFKRFGIVNFLEGDFFSWYLEA